MSAVLTVGITVPNFSAIAEAAAAETSVEASISEEENESQAVTTEAESESESETQTETSEEPETESQTKTETETSSIEESTSAEETSAEESETKEESGQESEEESTPSETEEITSETEELTVEENSTENEEAVLKAIEAFINAAEKYNDLSVITADEYEELSKLMLEAEETYEALSDDEMDAFDEEYPELIEKLNGLCEQLGTYDPKEADDFPIDLANIINNNEDSSLTLNSGSTYTLSSDANISNALTLDLNGCTVEYSSNYGFEISGSDVTIKNGKIKCVSGDCWAIRVQSGAELTLDDVEINYSGDMMPVAVLGTVNIIEECSIDSENVTFGAVYSQGGTVIVSDGAYIHGNCSAVVLTDKNDKLEVSGQNTVLESDNSFAVSSHGTGSGAKISIEDASIVSDGGCAAIYLPCPDGETTISGTAFVEGGTTGIEIRAGKLTISGAAEISTREKSQTSVEANGSGSTTDGAGIAIAQHTTCKSIEVIIEGGTITGYTPIYESNPQSNSAEDIAKVSISVTDGTFESTGTASVYSEDNEGFLTGGGYSIKPDDKYIADGYEAIQASDDYWYIKKTSEVTDSGNIEAIDSAVNSNISADEVAAPDGISKETAEDYAEDVIDSIYNNMEAIASSNAPKGLVEAIADENKLRTVLLSSKRTDTIIDLWLEINLDGIELEAINGEPKIKKLTFDVTPYANEFDTILNSSLNKIEVIPDSYFNGKTIKFMLPIPSQVTETYAKVMHKGNVNYYTINGSGDDKNIWVSTDSFSPFYVEFTNTLPSTDTDSTDSSTSTNDTSSSKHESNRNHISERTIGISETSGGSGSSGSTAVDTSGRTGTWRLDNAGWWFEYSDGTWPYSSWQELWYNGSKDWYHFNADGYLDSGLYTDTDGQVYYLHEYHDGTFGHMHTGWSMVNGSYRYFMPGTTSEMSKGAMLKDAVTPDGYSVNADGVWIE